MSNFDRRQFLKGLLGTLASAAGTVVLASTAHAQQPPASETPPDDLSERADRLAGDAACASEPTAAEFLNHFRNGGPGWHNGWRNGGWSNTGFRNGPGWHNGGFRNGGFNNSPWGNGGGFGNGGFRNGGFRNGNTWLNW